MNLADLITSAIGTYGNTPSFSMPGVNRLMGGPINADYTRFVVPNAGSVYPAQMKPGILEFVGPTGRYPLGQSGLTYDNTTPQTYFDFQQAGMIPRWGG